MYARAMALSFFALCAGALASPAYANLIVNGGFEASNNPTTTPPGWTNIGHSDGVIPYTYASTPVYEGLYFYDLGGFGKTSGPVGDGIEQTVSTTPGSLYVLQFGLSSEDTGGISTLRVQLDSAFQDYNLTSTETFLKKGFTTETINFVATSSSTTISFIETANPGAFGFPPGDNDPMIDGVTFDTVTSTNVPEPLTLSLFGAGLAGAVAMRRRKKKTD